MKELEQSEIANLNAYRQVFDNIIRELGSIAVQQKYLDTRRINAENALDENQKGQQDLLKSLEEKYGAGQLDLDRGLFIPNTPPELVEPVEENKEAKPKRKTTARKKS